MTNNESFTLRPIGRVQSSLQNRQNAPRQGFDGAPDAWVELDPSVADALLGVEAGQDVILITWLHESERDVLRVHPQRDPRNPLTGVFATRSPDRPNPLGLHRVHVHEIDGLRLRVGPLDAIDGTPIVDVKCILDRSVDS